MRDDVRRWARRSSFTADQWTASELARAKDGARVSVVLPAHQEESTVGAIVAAIRRDLMQTVPLVDELVVIDSHSTDRTAQAAREAGATVVHQGAVLPELGDRRGKGEALWKSLLVTTGDVVVFVDADLREFDTQLVVGLLGPLLTWPELSFVKACYDRPLANGDTVHPTGGGRVTELLARPLLSLYFPDLAEFAQPLAGEYAGRRSLLERLPFVVGYGVDVALLIDAVRAVGLERVAQVDLGVRHHRNRTLDELGPQALAVGQAILDRAGVRPPGDAVLHRPGLEPLPVPMHERPPLASL
jgi:glucosyl-3-phosphoglycerate synthase